MSPSIPHLILGTLSLSLLYHLRRRHQTTTRAQVAKAEQLANKFHKSKQNRARAQSFSIERNSVTVQVPATSANLGSGYDCVGMAVDIWNELTVTRSDKFKITVEGEGAEDIPTDESNLVVVGLKAAFKAAGKPVPALHYHCNQKIPHARGLGSSSAAIVSGILAGLVMAGHQLDIQGKEALLQIATEIEGHPDNVAPAMYGGVQLGIFNEMEQRWQTERIRLPDGIVFVMFIPNFTGKTSELRRVVPKEVPIQNAIFNMGRVAWLVHGLMTGKIENLRQGLEDRLHQKQRGDAVYHHLEPMINAAYEAGAVGAYLSGAGPCVMALTDGGSGDYFTHSASQRRDQAVASALLETAKDLGIDGKVYVTHPSNVGGVVVKADPPFSSELVTFNGET